MDAQWHYANNTFEVVTRNSNKKALILFEDTRAKLSSEGMVNANVQLIADDFEPHYTAYQNLYAQKQSINGLYEGKTLSFELMLEDLPTKIRKWEGQVHAIYPEDTPEERSIFPNRRNPFLNGPYELRISAIKSLADVLGTYPALASTGSSVSSYYNQIEGARLLQQQHEGNSERYSALLEDQRKITCSELYGALARLMNEFRYNPDRITTFFDLSLIRTRSASGGTLLISGTVTDKTSGSPLQGVSVQLSEGGYETITDAAGKYSLEVEAGTYQVRFGLPGYISFETPSTVFLKDKDQTINAQLTMA